MTKINHRRGRDASDGHGAPGHRQARLEHVIQQELQLLLQDADDHTLLDVTVSAVTLSADGAMARVHYGLPPGTSTADSRKIHTSLERAGGFLRAGLADGLDLKRTPSLRFVAGPAGGGDDEPEDAWWK
jgi:ribosome-binding factor A